MTLAKAPAQPQCRRLRPRDESLGPHPCSSSTPWLSTSPAPRWPRSAEPQVAPIVTVQPSPLPQRAVSADIIVVDQPRMPTPGPVGGAEPAAPSTTASMAVAPSAQPSQTVAPLPVRTEELVGPLPDSATTGLPAIPPVVNIIPPTPQNSQPESHPVTSQDAPKPAAEEPKPAEPLPRVVREVEATRILGEMWGVDSSLMPPGPPATRTRGRSRANSVQTRSSESRGRLEDGEKCGACYIPPQEQVPRTCQPDIVRAPSTPAVNAEGLF